MDVNIRKVSQMKRSRMLLENPRVNWFPHYMALDVLVAKKSVRVNLVHNLGEVVELRV